MSIFYEVNIFVYKYILYFQTRSKNKSSNSVMNQNTSGFRFKDKKLKNKPNPPYALSILYILVYTDY